MKKKINKKKESKTKKTYKSVVKKDVKKAKKEFRKIGDVIKSDWRKLTKRKKNPGAWEGHEIVPNSYYIVEYSLPNGWGDIAVREYVHSSKELELALKWDADKISAIHGPYKEPPPNFPYNKNIII